MNLITKIQRFFTGYDFFISYSRLDCSEYASDLANKIIEKKYSCYVDQWGSLPGNKLPRSLQRKIKNSSVLILLGSNASLKSKAIEEEINIFLSTKKIIIPVELYDISEANWFKSIEGLAISDEKINFRNKHVSENLLTRLKNSLNYTRQSIRIRNSIIFFLLLMIASIGTLCFLFSERKKLQQINYELEDSIQVKKESINNIGKVIKLKEDTLKRMSTQLSLMRNTLDIKEKSLSNIDNELKLNKKELKEVNIGFVNSKLQINEFTQRTLNNYEPNINWDCEQCTQKEFVILFEKDQARLRPNYIKSLNKLINCLKSHEGKIQLESYDFESPVKAYALKLSQNRGDAVATYLMHQGISGERIIKKGLGNHDDGKKLLNLIGVSRTEITIKND